MKPIAIFCTFGFSLSLILLGEACNEYECASLVSKCLLLKSCECDMTDKKNCTCCKECHKCLAKLYTECCSCVGMCPDHSNDHSVMKSSSVEELEDPMPELFDVLTEEEDPYLRWTTYNYPAHLDLLYFKPRGNEDHMNFASNADGAVDNEEHRIRHGGHHIVLDPHSKVMNCTVAYMSKCMALNKCKASCQSMGAARYRWFHQYGCCECIGSTCLDYGKGEPHCLQCPLKEGEKDLEDEYYYTVEEDSEDEEVEEGEDEEEEDEDDDEEGDMKEDLTKEVEDKRSGHASLNAAENSVGEGLGGY